MNDNSHSDKCVMDERSIAMLFYSALKFWQSCPVGIIINRLQLLEACASSMQHYGSRLQDPGVSLRLKSDWGTLANYTDERCENFSEEQDYLSANTVFSLVPFLWDFLIKEIDGRKRHSILLNRSVQNSVVSTVRCVLLSHEMSTNDVLLYDGITERSILACSISHRINETMKHIMQLRNNSPWNVGGCSTLQNLNFPTIRIKTNAEQHAKAKDHQYDGEVEWFDERHGERNPSTRPVSVACDLIGQRVAILQRRSNSVGLRKNFTRCGTVVDVELSTDIAPIVTNVMIKWWKSDCIDEEDSKLSASAFESAKFLYDSLYKWTTCHQLIGRKVAKYFNTAGKKMRKKWTLFRGEVMSYCPPPDITEIKKMLIERDEDEGELFHVVWDDGDEEDMDREDLEEALELYEEEGDSA